MVSQFLVPNDIYALHSITWVKYWNDRVAHASIYVHTKIKAHVSLLFQYFTHMIECNAQMSIGTRNHENTVLSLSCLMYVHRWEVAVSLTTTRALYEWWRWSEWTPTCAVAPMCPTSAISKPLSSFTLRASVAPPFSTLWRGTGCATYWASATKMREHWQRR